MDLSDAARKARETMADIERKRHEANDREAAATACPECAELRKRIAELARERGDACDIARAAIRERDEAIQRCDSMDTAAQHRAERYCREKREAERERDEALAKLTERDAGIRDALAATTIGGMRAPLIGCTMRRLSVSVEDRKWAEDALKDGA